MLSYHFCMYKMFCHTSSWLTSIFPFLLISRIKLQMDFFISLWIDERFWSTCRSLQTTIKSLAFQNKKCGSSSFGLIWFLPAVLIHETMMRLYLNAPRLWENEIHTHCWWSLTPLQSVSFSPAAEGSHSPCAVCGFYKHLQGTGN